MDNQIVALVMMKEIETLEGYMKSKDHEDNYDYYKGMVQAYRNAIKTICPSVKGFETGGDLLWDMR